MMSNQVKCLLIHQGDMENYGFMYVAGEMKRLGCGIRWIDANQEKLPLEMAIEYVPKFILFSPTTLFFREALEISKILKEKLPGVKSIFGGHHVLIDPGSAEEPLIDYIVRGHVYGGVLEKILDGSAPRVQRGRPGKNEELRPARDEFYRDIPKLAEYPVHYVMSFFGCPYNCSYCSTSFLRDFYGPKEFNRLFMKRRPPRDVVEESRIFLAHPTREVFMIDDDGLHGNDVEAWLEEFGPLWEKEINLPILTYVTPRSVARASDKTLALMSKYFLSVVMGIQSLDAETLDLFNRNSHNEHVIRKAIERLKAFDIPVRCDVIFGAPIGDPVQKALETITKLQTFASHCSFGGYGLMVFPETELERRLNTQGIGFDNAYNIRSTSGETTVHYDAQTRIMLRKLAKLLQFFVSYKIDEYFMKALIHLDISDHDTLYDLSIANFHLAQRIRYGAEGDKIAAEKLKTQPMFL